MRLHTTTFAFLLPVLASSVGLAACTASSDSTPDGANNGDNNNNASSSSSSSGGDGTSSSSSSSSGGGASSGEPGPGDVLLPSAKAVSITAGNQHTCVVTDQGAVRCWGYSNHGEVGNGVDTSKAYGVPVAVKGLDSGVKMISSGGSFTCALTQTNGVKCWGEDSTGQLGTGIPYTDNRVQQSSTPVDVKDLTSGVLAISVGDASACALLEDHTVKCWGQNGSWIGDGNDHLGGDTDTPNFVTASDTHLTNIAQISVGFEHACAVTMSGTVKCWGVNTFGEIGVGTETPRYPNPTDVPNLTNVASVSAGGRSTCALLKTGAAKCWGTRESGALGDGVINNFDDATTPIDVAGGLSGASEIAAGSGYTCAITSGLIKCWGDSDALGFGDSGYRTYLPKDAVSGLTDATHVALGVNIACAVLTSGAVKCWGSDAGEALGNGTGDGSGLSSQTPVAVLSLP